MREKNKVYTGLKWHSAFLLSWILCGCASSDHGAVSQYSEVGGSAERYRNITPAPKRTQAQIAIGEKLATIRKQAAAFCYRGDVLGAREYIEKETASAWKDHAPLHFVFGKLWLDILLRCEDYDEILRLVGGDRRYTLYKAAAQAFTGDWRAVQGYLKPNMITDYIGVKQIEKDLPDLDSRSGVISFALIAIGLDYDMEVNLEAARWYYAKAYRLSPGNVLCAYEYAESLSEQANHSEALRVLQSSPPAKSGLDGVIKRSTDRQRFALKMLKGKK